MDPPSDPALESAFGSRARLLTLAALANAARPLTGYRVAAMTGVPRPKVYPILRRAVAAGLVRETRTGFRLIDPDVRTLLRKRIRIYWLDDLLAEHERREPEVREVTAWLRRTKRARVRGPPGWQPRNPRLYRRDPEKDRILREMGLQPSVNDPA
jgi:hypothetical protein